MSSKMRNYVYLTEPNERPRVGSLVRRIEYIREVVNVEYHLIHSLDDIYRLTGIRILMHDERIEGDLYKLITKAYGRTDGPFESLEGRRRRSIIMFFPKNMRSFIILPKWRVVHEYKRVR